MQKIKKILVITGPGIGDVVSSLPVIENLKFSFPDAKIDVMNETSYGVGSFFLKITPHISKTIRFYRESPKLGSLFKVPSLSRYFFGKASIPNKALFVLRTAKENYDLVFNCFPSTCKSAIFSFLVGRKIRAGFSTTSLSFLFNARINPLKKKKIDVEAELVKKIGGKIKALNFEFRLNLENERKKIKKILSEKKIKSRFAIFHLGRKNKCAWPIENWVKISKYLQKKNFDVVVIGSVDDAEISDALATQNPKVHNLTNLLSLTELLALFEKSKLFIGINSGIMHLAAFSKVKVIALQGPSLYGWEAYGENATNIRGYDYKFCNGPLDSFECFKFCKEEYSECMKSISTERVISEIKNQLKN